MLKALTTLFHEKVTSKMVQTLLNSLQRSWFLTFTKWLVSHRCCPCGQYRRWHFPLHCSWTPHSALEKQKGFTLTCTVPFTSCKDWSLFSEKESIHTSCWHLGGKKEFCITKMVVLILSQTPNFDFYFNQYYYVNPNKFYLQILPFILYGMRIWIQVWNTKIDYSCILF